MAALSSNTYSPSLPTNHAAGWRAGARMAGDGGGRRVGEGETGAD